LTFEESCCSFAIFDVAPGGEMSVRALVRVMSVIAVVFLLLSGASTAGAQESAAPVDRIEVSTGSYRLELVMDRPVTAAQVARYEQELRGMLRHEQQVDGPVDWIVAQSSVLRTRTGEHASNGSAIGGS
jgi:hypothetical protein